MWVDPNIVFPPGRLEVRQPGKGGALTSPSRQQPPKEEALAHCSEARTAGPLPPSSGEPSPRPKRFAPPPGTWEVGALGCGQGGSGRVHQRVPFSRDDAGLTGSEMSCALGSGRRPGGPRHCPPSPPEQGPRSQDQFLLCSCSSQKRRRLRTRMTAPRWLSRPLTEGPPSRAGGFGRPAARSGGPGPGPPSITST